MITRARVTVPVAVDRSAATTLPVAAAIARQCGAAVELVDRHNDDHDAEGRLRACRDAAKAAGAPEVTYVLLARDDDVAAYATWSGSSLLCVGTGHRRPIIGRGVGDLIARAAVPVVVLGPRVAAWRRQCSRLVVALDGARADDALVATASGLGYRLGVPLILTQVLAPSLLLAGDVVESSFLHRAAEALPGPASTFDVLHATRPADGILRFVRGDRDVVLVLGAPVHAHRWQRAGPVVSAVVRRARGPVVLVPAQ